MAGRIDYDAVADQYDAQPYRAKAPDPELLSFAAGRSLRVLDLACGTGSQIAANAAAEPAHEYTGVDASAGMLAVARDKLPQATWIQATADRIPLPDQSFDFATCQFAYHHFDLSAALPEVHRLLRPGGRFVLSNVAPHEYSDGAFYRMFPEAFDIDAQHFLPTAQVEALMVAAGFSVEIETRFAKEGETLGDFADYVGVRTNNSHLTAVSDEAYEAGMARVREAIAHRGRDAYIDNPIVIKVFRADRQSDDSSH